MAEVGRRARKLGPTFTWCRSPSIRSATRRRGWPSTPRATARTRAWSFLTGPADAIEAAVIGGFKDGMGKEKVAAPGGNGDDATFWEIFHGEHLVLVDRQLRIRGYFEATPQGIDLLWTRPVASSTALTAGPPWRLTILGRLLARRP